VEVKHLDLLLSTAHNAAKEKYILTYIRYVYTVLQKYRMSDRELGSLVEQHLIK
jgi:hypothetical protein